MSLISTLKTLVGKPNNTYVPATPLDGWLVDADIHRFLSQSPAELYRTQPHLRTVINFRARNVAQLGLHVFERVSDTDRVRATGTAVGILLAEPNPDSTMFEVMRDTVCDLDLYGAAYWLLIPDAASRSGWQLRIIPPTWIVGTRGGSMWQPAEYRVCPGNGCDEWLDARDFIVFRDWNPNGAGSPVSPIEALRDILAEQIEAWKYRRQVWERGGRVGTYISRPAESNGGEWSMEARQRFRADWKAFVASGAKAGSTPILEDGMKLEKVGFSAKEEEWVESTRLSLQTVAQVYHVQPAMIGETSGASYASTREFRSMLYTETLGPLLAMIEKRLNQFLVPRVAPDTRLYVEFNIEAKLAGNFEEQAGILSTATGAPWMTVNEARALRNLPSLPDGDGLVVPLNVVKGGQASPQDGGEPSAAVEAARDGGGQ